MPDHAPNVVVIGSINMDLVVQCPTIPQPGETVLGEELRMIPGGKGANQAVGAARLGAECHMVGTVGRDTFGQQVTDALREAGVQTDHVRVTDRVTTGAALITVNPNGENAICVAGGANREVSPEDVDNALPLLRTADVCLLQMEIPLETNLRAIRLCRELGVTVVLDAAPAIADPPAELFRVDALTANAGEAATLTGLTGDGGFAHARSMIEAMGSRGASQAVLKLGANGALAWSGGDVATITAHAVEVVDTTAAGDAFNAALGFFLASRHSLFGAVRRANGAGALACTTLGAMPAMPTLEALNQLIGDAVTR